ncbi:LacI family DNA-binding transcriptional regulator [Microbacterium suaedae]|uniref:LacI family DNA-binding transcriptional regulator n=1 Tax=Microbacterium suaedae TaxID=2067813 RepID=UPI000DA21679|nr:LacI family DNA-binding transcriptional regulator [Microbacterium suaedae]
MARPRISDVAAAAGVSPTTVSHALNDTDARVAADTRARVKRIAREIGYTPSSLARGLRTRRTRTVGMISDVIATTPFAGQMLAGAQDAARENGHLLILTDTGDDRDVEREAISALVSQQVDAMIYATMWHRAVDVPSGLPSDTVFLDCRPADASHRSVVPDDRAGGASAARELVEAGHRRIAYLSSDDPRAIAADLRRDGFLEVLSGAGISHDPALILHGDGTTASGRRLATELLRLPDDQRPTAMFCFNDRMAGGAYRAAHDLGLSIPHDLSVVGFDDQQYHAAEQEPPLTTIALPHYEMGRWAMEVVLGVRDADPKTSHLMPCPVVRRDSVGPPPARSANLSRRRTIPNESAAPAAPEP